MDMSAGFSDASDDTSFDLPEVSAVEMTVEQVRQASLRSLRERFPHLCVWYGEHTQRWWAMLGGRLVEQETADALARQVARWRSGEPI